MALKVSEFKRGQGVYWRDGIWVFEKMDHVKPGKGPAYVQAELRNSRTGQIVSNRFRPEESLEPVHFDRQRKEYLYSDASGHVFMDPENYEQMTIPKERIGEQDVYLVPNCQCEICMVEGEILTIELPNVVELTIKDTPPVVKGATATNQPKDAVCEGGAKVRVPAFIEIGEVVKVDTRTGEYLGRA